MKKRIFGQSLNCQTIRERDWIELWRWNFEKILLLQKETNSKNIKKYLKTSIPDLCWITLKSNSIILKVQLSTYKFISTYQFVCQLIHSSGFLQNCGFPTSNLSVYLHFTIFVANLLACSKSLRPQDLDSQIILNKCQNNSEHFKAPPRIARAPC